MNQKTKTPFHCKVYYVYSFSDNFPCKKNGELIKKLYSIRDIKNIKFESHNIPKSYKQLEQFVY